MTSTTSDQLEALLADASRAADVLWLTPSEVRAHALELVADSVGSAREELVAVAEGETGLTAARLDGELTRTVFQLRYFAEVVRLDDWRGSRVDEADASYPPAPRPDLRRRKVPVGPVLVYAASNFPFAFSVLGGDFASALAAGCPVIVKVNSGHIEVSRRCAEIAQAAFVEAGLPATCLQTIDGQEASRRALKDSRVKAASFTGSTEVGVMLSRIAANRAEPAPFFGELGSTNPAVITQQALSEDFGNVATGLAASIAGSAGQLCTKPGVVFVPNGSPIADRLANSFAETPEHRLLTPGISNGYLEKINFLESHASATFVQRGESRIDKAGNAWVKPSVAKVSFDVFEKQANLLSQEVFGPFVLLVEYDSIKDVTRAFDSLFEGNLTATLRLGAEEWTPDLAELASKMTRLAGRVLFDGWPTGVSVTDAMQHGGPWPAANVSSSTSVGSAAIDRFARPVAFQSAPKRYLPDTLGGRLEAM